MLSRCGCGRGFDSRRLHHCWSARRASPLGLGRRAFSLAHPRRRFRAAPTTGDSSPEGLVEIWRPKRYEVVASSPLTPNSVRHRSHVRFPAESHELTRSGSPVHRVLGSRSCSTGSTAYLKTA